MRTFLEWVDHPDLDNESHYSAKLKHFNNNIEFPKLSIADREFLHTYTNDSSEVNSNLWTITNISLEHLYNSYQKKFKK
jgi:hypothetical protein